MDADGEKPAWWIENERDRAALDLPEYEPPRFEDGVYVHEVVPGLESDLGCEIRFIGMNVDWGDEWDVTVDGEAAFPVQRSRDDSGNTIYRIGSDEFRERLLEATE